MHCILLPYLVLVSGVERDLSNFGGFLPHFLDWATAEFNALQQSRLRGITSHISLDDEDKMGKTILSRLSNYSIGLPNYCTESLENCSLLNLLWNKA